MFFIEDKAVKKIATMPEAISIVEKAFEQYSNKNAIIPNRIQIELSDKKSAALYMPGYSDNFDSLGIKIVTIFPDNLDLDLKTTNALIVLNSIKTGIPIAIIEANYLTALRTGAASGVATKYLSKKDSTKLAIIGAGYQARTQLEAVCCVRNITAVRVYDINIKRANQYIYDKKNILEKFNIIYQLASSPEEAVFDADIICTATTSKKPLFKVENLKRGVHINAIGSFTPNMQEIDEQVIIKANKICVDSIPAVLEEAGDIIIPLKKGLISQQDIYCEIGKIISGEKLGRENDEEITFFKTVGISIQDIAVGKYIYQKAKKIGIAKEL